MKIAITGHRPNKLGNDYNLTSPIIGWLTGKIVKIIQEYKPDTLITGMALGIDTLFAKIAIQLNISFIAAIPCKQQYVKWSQKSKEIWMDITDHKLCEKYYVTEELYSNTCMQLRNQWMVDNCDILIAVWDESSGGTKNCVDYAKSVNKQIVYINPKDFK